MGLNADRPKAIRGAKASQTKRNPDRGERGI
jgi:hypothetical protein